MRFSLRTDKKSVWVILIVTQNYDSLVRLNASFQGFLRGHCFSTTSLGVIQPFVMQCCPCVIEEREIVVRKKASVTESNSPTVALLQNLATRKLDMRKEMEMEINFWR